MKLRNKKTGEIVDLVKGYIKDSYYGQKIEIKPLAISNKEGYMYNSLAELNEEWEDYEEPKGNWTIDPMNENYTDDGKYTAPDELERYEELGLKFDTEEEAKKAVEKLKAWKRLKDKGFEFCGTDCINTSNVIYFEFVDKPLTKSEAEEAERELEICFGGKE